MKDMDQGFKKFAIMNITIMKVVLVLVLKNMCCFLFLTFGCP